MNSTRLTTTYTNTSTTLLPQAPSLGQLVLCDSLGRRLQTWDLSQSKCIIGSNTNCTVRCYMPGIAEHHALLVIGGRQVFLRALASGVTRDGEPLAEFIMRNDDESLSFEISGHRFEFRRTAPSIPAQPEVASIISKDSDIAEPPSAPASTTSRLQFTLVKAMEKNRAREDAVQNSEPVRPVGNQPPSTVPQTSTPQSIANPQWIEGAIQAAVQPIERRLEALVEPLEQVQQELRRKRKRRKVRDAIAPAPTEQNGINDAELESWIESQKALQQSVTNQANRLELVNERVSDILNQIAVLEKLVTSENNSSASGSAATQAVEAELLRLQQDTLKIVEGLRAQATSPSDTTSELDGWRSSMQSELGALQAKIDALVTQQAISESRSTQIDSALSQQREQITGLEQKLVSSLEEIPAKILAQLPALLPAPIIQQVAAPAPSTLASQPVALQPPAASHYSAPAQFDQPASMSDTALRKSLPPFIDEPEDAGYNRTTTADPNYEASPAGPDRFHDARSFDGYASNNSSYDAQGYDSSVDYNNDSRGYVDNGLDSSVNGLGGMSNSDPYARQNESHADAPSESQYQSEYGSGQDDAYNGQSYDQGSFDNSYPSNEGSYTADPSYKSAELPSWWTNSDSNADSPSATNDDSKNAYQSSYGSGDSYSRDQSHEGFGPSAGSSLGFESESSLGSSLSPHSADSSYAPYDSSRYESSHYESSAHEPSVHEPSAVQPPPAVEHAGFGSAYGNSSPTAEGFDSHGSNEYAGLNEFSPARHADSGLSDNVAGASLYSAEEYGANESYHSEVAAHEQPAVPEEDEDSSVALMERLRKQLEAAEEPAHREPEAREPSQFNSGLTSSQSAVSPAPPVREKESLFPKSLTTGPVLSSAVMDESPLNRMGSKPAAANSGSGEESEESVEEYMRRLLARMRGVSESEVQVTTTSASPTPSNSHSSMPESRSTRPEPVNTPVEIDEPVSESWTAPFDPDSYVPKIAAPEKARDLNAMRELANTSARSAIQVSARRRHSTALLLKMTISGVGFVASISLFLINGFRMNIPFIASVLAFAVGVIWAYDAMSTIKPLIKSARQSSDPAASKGTRNARRKPQVEEDAVTNGEEDSEGDE